MSAVLLGVLLQVSLGNFPTVCMFKEGFVEYEWMRFYVVGAKPCNRGASAEPDPKFSFDFGRHGNELRRTFVLRQGGASAFDCQERRNPALA